MSKGLAKLLDSITNNPDQRLIDRYLALITDIESESEKRARALDLAATLVNQKSAEAMRIAHMVFKADPQNLRSLDIIIESLEDRGSKGKAAVLRNERAKLVALKDEQPEKLRPDATTVSPELSLDFSGVKNQADGSGRPRDNNVDVPINVDLPHRPFNISQNEKQIPKNNSDFQYKANAEKAMFPTDAPHYRGGPTEIADDNNQVSSRDATELDISMSFHTVVDASPMGQNPHNPEDKVTEYILQPGQILENPPETETSDLGVGVELFDYYWRQGFIGRAQKLLEQMAPLAGEEAWWQARNKLLKNSNIDFVLEMPENPAQVELEKTADESKETWKEILSSYNEICPQEDVVLIESAFFQKISKLGIVGLKKSAPAMDDLMSLIKEFDFKNSESRKLLCVMIANYFWSSTQDRYTIKFLRDAEIEDFSLRIWGIYLDALVYANQGRKARFEIFRTLSKKPHLPWAKSAYSRLNDVFEILGLQRFEWNEDDGVQPLLKAVSSHRPLSMSAVVV